MTDPDPFWRATPAQRRSAALVGLVCALGAGVCFFLAWRLSR